MTRYEHVLELLDQVIGGPSAQIGKHGAFWRGLSRDEFVAKSVRGLPLVTLGMGAESNIVQALKGEGLFGADLANPPPDSLYSRMPAGFAPMAAENIDFIEQWIDDNCPEDQMGFV